MRLRGDLEASAWHPFTTVTHVSSPRWQVEQVLALAPRPSSVTAAQPIAVPTRWSGTGCHSRAVWGRCIGGSAEPYECVVDHVDVAFRCTCQSRVVPCKHGLALLLLWARGEVAEGEPPVFASTWLAKRSAAADGRGAPATVVNEPAVEEGVPPGVTASAPTPPPEPGTSRDDRI